MFVLNISQHPRFIVTLPAGLNRMMHMVPLSTHRLSYLVKANGMAIAETVNALADFFQILAI